MRKEDYIKVSDGCNIFCCEKGEGKPIIFIHGWSSNGNNSFAKVSERLCKDARCISFDLRGHGKSGLYSQINIEKLTEDLHDMIIELDLFDVILVGHSLGGLVIYSYFERYNGERVSAISVIDMSPKVLCDSSWEHGLCCFSRLIFPSKPWLYLFSKYISALCPFTYEAGLFSLWVDMLDADYRQGAKNITVPMIYFYSQNGMYPNTVCDWLVNNVRKMKCCTDLYPSNHFTMLNEVDKIVAGIRALI